MDWNFSTRLENARTWRGWSKTELSKRSGVTISQIHKLFHEHNPRARIETLRQLAQALGVSSDYLLGLSNDMNPQPLPLPKEMIKEGSEEKDFEDAVAQLASV
ncbi:MAG: hypothetical protein ETSY1_46610 (plasmid) [Candidatus Entotheonella factor]|uniref:HTH cro/C1-type domain-containing protein n=1 Tax=Entotheonella factor TaxID=1429438 RepID=W4LZW6_ENTF1|nr:MAG: hypothetical protein ETSY1_46610 [Candidatus Entotheonella factor]